MKRLQIYYPEELLDNLRLYAENKGEPVAEAIREASREFIGKQDVHRIIITLKKIKKKKNTTNDPILAMDGMLRSGPINASTTVNDIYEED